MKTIEDLKFHRVPIVTQLAGLMCRNESVGWSIFQQRKLGGQGIERRRRGEDLSMPGLLLPRKADDQKESNLKS